jgi:flagellar motor protein MotB
MLIQEQDRAYKRGLVLGLTMAEIIILILFCLLLALATVFATHRKQIAEQKAAIERQSKLIEDLGKAAKADPEDLRLVAALKEYWERYAPKNVDQREYFRELVLKVEELHSLRRELEQLVEKNRDLEERARTADKLARRVEELTKRVDQAEKEFDAVKKVVAVAGVDVSKPNWSVQLETILKGPGVHTWPPIIVLKETDDYRFEKGSAELSANFRQQLLVEVVPQLLKIVSLYDVDVVEVIGHTDEQPIAPRPSNLDGTLRKVLRDHAPITELIPADNAGLGIARAVSVVQVLASDQRLSKLKILPMSGAQLIEDDRMTDWTRSGDIPARRRIEIRVRRTSVRQAPVGAESKY